MEAYSSFAEVYDLFMDDVPYLQWKDALLVLFARYQVPKGLVAELACGTGKMTRLLAREGFDLIGIDRSQEMLAVAAQQASEGDILYLCQDMRSFELYGTVRAVVCICDGMNYVTDPGELREVFSLVNNYLDPGGVFIFDMNTIYKFREVLGDNVFAENRDEGSFIWENDYDETSGLNTYGLTLYIRRGERYDRFEEVHVQRGYTEAEVRQALVDAGMEVSEVLDADTMRPPTEESRRLFFVARECMKERV